MSTSNKPTLPTPEEACEILQPLRLLSAGGGIAYHLGRVQALIRDQEARIAAIEQQPVSVDEANELQDILRTLTNSGTALKTSARALVALLSEKDKRIATIEQNHRDILQRVGEEATKQMAEKDAEIERLASSKADVAAQMERGTKKIRKILDALQRFKEERGSHAGDHYQKSPDNPTGTTTVCAKCYESYIPLEAMLDAFLEAR